ncbi:FecR family protein [Neolewinella sp.]|uniref:FecR family protein n=1 Tax=Neolewinella sp. TaxID=2993543 RepID=UPI003B51EF5F
MSLNNDDIDRLVTTYREDFTPDVEQGLRRLHAEMTVVRPLPTRSRPTSRRRWFSIAAAVAVIVACLAVFFLQGDGRTHLSNPDRAQATFTLPDGSSITLQQGASASYDPTTYDVSARDLELSGQAYFEVHPDATRPFLVRHGGGELRVTGTAFNLRTDGALMEVEVSQGAVVLEQDGKSMQVAANECGLIAPGQPMVHKPAPNLNHHAWRTGELKFDHTPIDEALTYFYDNWAIRCTWANDQACHYTVSGNYRGGDAGAVLADIAKLGGATLRALDDTGKHYELSGPCTE